MHNPPGNRKHTIPVCTPHVPLKAKEYIASIIENNCLGSNIPDGELNFIRKLETAFCDYIGSDYGIAVTSGTAALQVGLAALGIGPGHEVIVPTFTMIATAAAVIHAGAQPVFIDADPDTWCMDVRQLEHLITPKTRAIIAVHIYGYPCDMEPILALAKKHGLFVIEDTAEAMGTRYKGKMAGSMGDIGCFSFYSNKPLTSGEGGMIVTNHQDVAERAACLKAHAFGARRFVHDLLGYNFRMTNLTAAYAYASCEEMRGSIRKWTLNGERYNELLASIEGIQLPPPATPECVNSYWMYGIRIRPNARGLTKERVRSELLQRYAVDTREFFCPMHMQPALLNRGYAADNRRFPVSEKLWEEGFYLPSGADLHDDEIGEVARSLREIMK